MINTSNNKIYFISDIYLLIYKVCIPMQIFLFVTLKIKIFKK